MQDSCWGGLAASLLLRARCCGGFPLQDEVAVRFGTVMVFFPCISCDETWISVGVAYVSMCSWWLFTLMLPRSTPGDSKQTTFMTAKQTFKGMKISQSFTLI